MSKIKLEAPSVLFGAKSANTLTSSTRKWATPISQVRFATRSGTAAPQYFLIVRAKRDKKCPVNIYGINAAREFREKHRTQICKDMALSF